MPETGYDMPCAKCTPALPNPMPAYEAASRALDEPSPTRIESLVHELVMDKLLDGQFDECDLTLAELHQIERSLTKSLCAIYHRRIAYPGDESEKPDESLEDLASG